MVREVEIKALLSEQKYGELCELLPKKFTKVNEDVITTTRFRPNYILVRHSDKIREIVFKDGNPTSVSRNELSINLKDRGDCEKTIALLKQLGFKNDPAWVKRKQEFVCKYGGFEYTLSLQHVENFAYLLEAEIMLEEEDDALHVENLKKVLESLGCQPIEPDEFNARIAAYVENNSRTK